MYLTIFNIRFNLQKVSESMFELKRAIDLMPIREYNDELNATWKMMSDMKTSLTLRLDAIEKETKHDDSDPTSTISWVQDVETSKCSEALYDCYTHLEQEYVVHNNARYMVGTSKSKKPNEVGIYFVENKQP